MIDGMLEKTCCILLTLSVCGSMEELDFLYEDCSTRETRVKDCQAITVRVSR